MFMAMVAYNINIDSNNRFPYLPNNFVHIGLLVKADAGFFGFVGSTICLLVLTHIIM